MEAFFLVTVICLFSIAATIVAIDVNKGQLTLRAYLAGIFSVYFCIIPLLYVATYDQIVAAAPSSWVVIGEPSSDRLLLFLMQTLIGIGSIVIGWLIGAQFFRELIEIRYLSNNQNLRLCYRLKLLALIPAALILYEIASLGGVASAINAGETLRAHGADWSVGRLYRLMPLLAVIVLVTSFKKDLFWYLMFTLAVIFLLIEQSRSNLTMFFFLLFIVRVNAYGKFSYIYIVFMAVIIVLVAGYGNEIIELLSSEDGGLKKKSREDFFFTAVSQLSPTFTNGMLADEFTRERGLQYFQVLSDMTPLHFIGVERSELVWQDLSAFYFNDFYRVGMQIDLFTYGYTQALALGVAISGLFYGAIFGCLDAHCRRLMAFPAMLEFANCYQGVLMLLGGSLLIWGSLDSAVLAGNLKYSIIVVIVLVSTVHMRRRTLHPIR